MVPEAIAEVVIVVAAEEPVAVADALEEAVSAIVIE
jgi:hypothetical protein